MVSNVDTAQLPLSSASDIELVELTRKGNSAAFGELWARHANAGRAVARSHNFDADDLLSEAFARIFQTIRAGGGPTAAFRPYLFTTIRNVSIQWGRAKSADASEDLDMLADPATEEDASLAALDRGITVQAFKSLPSRWQEALWYSEVEQLSSQQIAPLLGMKANAVSALTYRAREGLRQAWITAHLARAKNPECAATIEKLGSFTRGVLGTRETKRVREHLEGCASCSIVAEEAREVGSRLALVLLPVAAGISGAAGFLAWLQTGGTATSIVAAAAGEQIVGMSGEGITAVTGVGGGVAAGTASSSSSAGGAGSAGSSSGGASVGTIVGMAVAGLAVAATIVAGITLGPSLFQNGDNSISAEEFMASQDSTTDVAPEPETLTPPVAPVVPPVPAPSPSAPAGDDDSDEGSSPATTPQSAPSSSPAPSPSTSTPPAPTTSPTPQPTTPPVVVPETPTVKVSEQSSTRLFPTISGSNAIENADVVLELVGANGTVKLTTTASSATAPESFAPDALAPQRRGLLAERLSVRRSPLPERILFLSARPTLSPT